MRSDKRGISAIVATVLIILITVAAVTIIWAAIIPMVSDPLDSAELCRKAATSVQIDKVCYANPNAWVTIKRDSSDFDLKNVSVSFSIDNGKNYASFDLAGQTNRPLPNLNEKVEYEILVGSVSIAGVYITSVVSLDGEEVTCDPTPVVEVSAC